jgi:hypothetical protein
MQTFSRMEQAPSPPYSILQSNDDGQGVMNPSTWQEWRKTATTRAMRIEGPFKVLTREGPLECPDGYLAVDAHGYPYPINKEEFEKIYEPVNVDA